MILARQSHVVSRLLLLMLIGLAPVALGCGLGTKPCVVQGVVQVNGAPAGGVYVVLTDSANQTAGSGRTDSTGAFRLTVATAGDYAVACFMPKVTKSPEGDVIEGEDLFNGRFRNPQLPVTKASLNAGENSLPVIQLR